ncbi:ferredoxin [Thermotoga maritima MSB8]|uniref:Ferredoxin n=1 Tax=Thermotoga maritima (strain ATCC 43589 / DSM 3109 / JCM 10099 / NBRC 100826 / MSB8) TaxID=243274 RepID=Q9WZY1_THEMA|nr:MULTISPECIES: 4Fe-4S binding protein [Thermotoga]AAD35960.1 ferredoxin [Thermotoga maritima MSB8]AGL49806.1 Ferredoxin [Thermotoga maritima MSB8]AHD17368.1 ferredoxin [Thermotoga maritima MSB8]AIY85600.1 ferredoxin [Thermotoga sp. 2812B]AKE26793.1 ferredoxin [Thermotoga maritima]
MGYKIVVNYDWCKACKLCAWACPTSAITSDEIGKPVTNENKCIGCLKCEKICPDMAIEIVSDENA